MYEGIPKYIPKVCPDAKRIGNHFECQQPTFGCSQTSRKNQHICPCYGKDFSGWIPVTKEHLQAKIKDVKRWNKCRERLPQKDEWSLEGFDGFRIHGKQILISEFDESEIETRKQQMIKLLDNGDHIGFNEDWGIGSIERTKKGFTLTKGYYKVESKPVVNGTIEDVINFLFSFWGNPEPFSYAKAGYPELERC